MNSTNNDLPLSAINSQIENEVAPPQAPLPKNINNPHINRGASSSASNIAR